MYFVEISCCSSLFKANVGPMLRSKDHELYSMCIIFVRITVTKLEGEVYIIQLENGKGGVGLGPILMIVRFGEKYNNHCQITRVGVYSTKMQESS